MSEREKSSFRQIIKSSALIGGSSVINVALGVLRTKVLAVLIGTEGMGLFGALSSVVTLASGICGMGINTSGVRQIAEAVGTQDQEKISRTALVLRRTSLALGILGMLAMLALCQPIAKVTFGNYDYTGALALLSVAVLFTQVAAGQTALVQGLRRIKDLAALSILGATLGTICSIPIIYFFRERGIVPFLITVAGLSVASSWWYARKVRLQSMPVPFSLVWAEARILLTMGVAFMASGMMSNAVAYFTRAMIIRQLGLDAAGLYQASYSLAGVYVGFVLNAMGADYYPRLTAVAQTNSSVNRMVNEQTEAALLMAIPGILGTLTFAPWVIHLLYSAAFLPAVDILRWQILGILGRIIIWPIGFVMLAKGRSAAFFLTELAANIAHCTFIWFGMKLFGLSGLGMAFFGLYLVHGPIVFFVVRRLSGFSWNKEVLLLGIASVLATAAVFAMTVSGLDVIWSTIGGSLLTGLAALYAAQKMAKRSGFDGLVPAARGLMAKVGFKTK